MRGGRGRVRAGRGHDSGVAVARRDGQEGRLVLLGGRGGGGVGVQPASRRVFRATATGKIVDLNLDQL